VNENFVLKEDFCRERGLFDLKKGIFVVNEKNFQFVRNFYD
jgi:hypothetical protein